MNEGKTRTLTLEGKQIIENTMCNLVLGAADGPEPTAEAPGTKTSLQELQLELVDPCGETCPCFLLPTLTITGKWATSLLRLQDDASWGLLSRSRARRGYEESGHRVEYGQDQTRDTDGNNKVGNMFSMNTLVCKVHRDHSQCQSFICLKVVFQ